MTFVGWTSSFALTAKRNEWLRSDPGSVKPGHHPTLLVEELPGDYAILTITNHGQQFLRFDSVGVECELNGAWVSVKPDKYWGLHGKAWKAGSNVYLRCPPEMPCSARWRVPYTCDLDPDPTRPPSEARPDPVAPVLMVTPILPARPDHSAADANLSGCQWSDLRNIGYIMEGLAQDVQWQALRPAAWAWFSGASLHERETMPPGAFVQSLASYARSAVDVGQFHGLLAAVIERLRGDPEKSNTLAAAVRIQDYIRSASAEPGTAPNSAHPGPSANQGGENRPPSVS